MDVSRKMGFLYYRAGDTKSALDAYGGYLKIAEQIYSQGNTSIRDRRAVAYGNERVGFIEARSGNVETGVDRLRRALATYETLAREDPNSVSAKRDVASVYTLIGDILKSNDRPKEAVQNYERALQVTHELSAADPKNVQYSRDLHLTLGHLSEAFVQAGMVADAQKATDQAIRVLKPLVDDPEPDDTDIYQYCMLLLEPKYKNVYDPLTARKYAEKLVERAGGKDPRTLELLASAHAAAGDYSRAIDAQSRALLLLPPQSTSDLRKLMEKELADYREKAAKRR
jgi:tetratricopeptide (TPR) repeat protein